MVNSFSWSRERYERASQNNPNRDATDEYETRSGGESASAELLVCALGILKNSNLNAAAGHYPSSSYTGLRPRPTTALVHFV